MRKRYNNIVDKIINNEELSSSGLKIAANIKFKSLSENIKTISIVSASKNEGKSTVAIQLASALAKSGYNTLLLDIDMHKKTISRGFSAQAKHSLFDILNGSCRFEEAIIATQYSNLYFLDCVRGVSSAPDIVGSKNFFDVFNTLKNNFDYIIVDTPPILPCVDGVLISQFCDASIVVARQYKTKVDEVLQMSDQLKIAKINTLGCVLNCADRSEYKYY